MNNQRGVVHLILILIVIIVAIGVGVYLVAKPQIFKSQAGSSANLPKVELKSEYKNPFDKNTQYVNPFDQYKNPFVVSK